MQTHHKHFAKQVSNNYRKRLLKKPKKLMREDIDKYFLKYAKLSDLGSNLGASCLNLSRCGAFVFATCLSKPLGVPDWTGLGLPCGTFGPIFLTF